MQVKEVGALAEGFFRERPLRRWVVLHSEAGGGGFARVGARVHSLSSLGFARAAGFNAVSRAKTEDTTTRVMWVHIACFPRVPRSMLDVSTILS